MADHPSHFQHDHHVGYPQTPPSQPPLPNPLPPPHQEHVSLQVHERAKPLRKLTSGASALVKTTVTGKHPRYPGIRCRSGKWVSEIREPSKDRRIWLGTYQNAEMAAVAYDVAARALRGADAVLNFPDDIASRPAPTVLSPATIRSAAAEAAASLLLKTAGEVDEKPTSTPQKPAAGGNESNESWNEGEYIDEEEMFDMPQLLVHMAEGC